MSTGLQGLVEEGEVRSLEQGLGRSDWVRRVGDDAVVGVLVFREELESVSDEDGNSWVLVAGRHVRKELLGHSDDGLVDITESDSLNGFVLEDLSDDTTISSSDNKDVLGVGVGSQRKMGNHLLVTDFSDYSN